MDAQHRFAKILMALGISLLALTSATIVPGVADNLVMANSQIDAVADASADASGAGSAAVSAEVLANAPALIQRQLPAQGRTQVTVAQMPAAQPAKIQPQQEATMMPTPEPPLVPAFILPEIPTRIEIPAIKVKAKVVPVGPGKTVNDLGLEWTSPNSKSVGWHNYSKQLGQTGNMVMNGHNNIYGSVFRKLYTLKAGDLITISSPSYWRTYVVSDVMILKEKGEPYEVLQQNASYISPLVTEDRLTLISCWPETNNTHRVIVLAKPVAQSY